MSLHDLTKRVGAALHTHFDLPLERDGSGRFLPWIVALMVYLATLSLAGLLVLQGTIQRWDAALVGTLTVQLPAEASGDLEKLLTLLRATPGIRSAEPLDHDANSRLLKPWLGDRIALEDLQLPLLVDLRLDPGLPLDRQALARQIASVVPAARLDDNGSWLSRVFNAILAIEIIAGIVVALVGAAGVISVIFATRTGLAIHHSTIEVLHLIGARDGYIARQFQWQALRLGLRGGFIGFIPAMLTLLGIRLASGAHQAGGEAAILAAFTLGLREWLILLLLPAIAGATALATARLTVLRALARMP